MTPINFDDKDLGMVAIVILCIVGGIILTKVDSPGTAIAALFTGGVTAIAALATGRKKDT